MKKILLIMLFIFLTFPSWVTAKNSKISLYLSKHDSFRIAGFLMAKKLGLYKKEGLDVTMIYEADHEKRTRKVLNEEHSYAVGSFAIVQEIAKKKDLALIGSIFQQTPLVLVYTNSKPYKNLTDLKGTTIMVSSWEEKAFLKLLLKQEGIRLDAVNIVEGSHPEKDFIQGNISAYVSSKALIASQLKEQPNSYRLVEPKTLGVEIYDDLLVTSTQQLNRFPKQVEAFYKASIRGWNYAFSHMYKSAVEIVSWNPDMIIDPLGLVVQADALKPFAMQQGSFLGQIDFVKVQKMMRYFDMQDAAPNKVNQLLYNKGYLKSETIYSEKEQLWLRQQKPIRVCIDRGFMPIESFNEQDLAVGILTDIIDVMRQKMNIKFEPIPVSGFMEKLEGLRKNRCDMVVIHHEDDTIEEHIHTVAMLETPMVYITQGSEPFFSSFSKMRDKKIAVTKDDPAIKALNRRYPEIELIEVESAAVGLKGVSKGQYDTFIGLLSVSTYYINAQGLSNLKVAGHIDVTMPLRLLLSKNDQSLMMLLNKAVQTMTESEKQQVIQKWMQVDYKRGINYGLFVVIVFIALWVIGFTLYFNYRLRKKVNSEVQKRRLQEQMLLQQSKLASIGEMIGNIAHQWRQPLMGLSALMMEIEAKIQSQGTISNDDLHNIVERANTTMRFMSTTINDFWNFFSKDKEATRFYPKDVIETTLSILNATLKKSSVTVNVKAYHECEVFGFKNEFSQAVINIISNAKDIMVERDIEKPTLTITLEQIEDYYEIIFEDNGGGIQVELLDRIFDPFVSERLISSSGIGLCMTKNIIEDSMKGKILVSNGTKGAKFVMRLPLASSQDELVSQT